MRIKYSDFAQSVARVKTVLADNRSEQVCVLFTSNIEDKTCNLAYSDGRKTIVNKIATIFGEADTANVKAIVPFKQIEAVMDLAKPVGQLQVEEVELTVAPERKTIKFKVDKVVYYAKNGGAVKSEEQEVDEDGVPIGATYDFESDDEEEDLSGVMDDFASEDDEAEFMNEPAGEEALQTSTVSEGSDEVERKVIATLQRSFTYMNPEDERRQAVLVNVDYDAMLASYVDENADEVADIDGDDNSTPASTGKVFKVADLVELLASVSTEDGSQIIMSSKSKRVSVKNSAFAVCIPNVNIADSMCLSAKVAKNIIDVFRRTGVAQVSLTLEDKFCTICTEDHKVAFKYQTDAALKRNLNVIDGYTAISYERYGIVVFKDALLNIIRCCNETQAIVCKFVGDAINGMKVKIEGGDTATKSNDFDVEAFEVMGDAELLSRTAIKMNTDAISKMVELCKHPYISLEFGASDDGAVALCLSDVHKDAGIIVRDLSMYTPVTVKEG